MKNFQRSILIVLLIFLSACTDNSSVPLQPNEETMIIHIKNNANFDFYAIEISTYKNGKLKTTGGMSNADGSKIEKGESFRQEYIDQEAFTLEGEATFEVTLLDNEYEDAIVLKKITLDLIPNREYRFEIIGDSIGEADLNRID